MTKSSNNQIFEELLNHQIAKSDSICKLFNLVAFGLFSYSVIKVSIAGENC